MVTPVARTRAAVQGVKGVRLITRRVCTADGRIVALLLHALCTVCVCVCAQHSIGSAVMYPPHAAGRHWYLGHLRGAHACYRIRVHAVVRWLPLSAAER